MIKGGLKLKRELVQSQPLKPTGPFTVAQIWVDASVYHLDSTFSYLIPGNLSSDIQVGSLVSIPFHGREIIGCVIALDAPESITGLKSISKVIGSFALLTPTIISLIQAASKRYAAHPFDLIRSAIPDRVASVEKEFVGKEVLIKEAIGNDLHKYLQLPAGKSRSELIAKKVASLSKDGSVLVIVPDSREVLDLERELITLGISAVVLDSRLPKSEYFRNFLSARLGLAKVVIGTRSAIFAPVSNLRSLIIYNEGSEHLYERRSPGWNVRDIALLRRQVEEIDIFFVGYSPSAEIARLIDEGWIEFIKSKSKVKVSTFQSTHGELLPSRALSTLKKSLKTGPILFIVPSKGYAQAIRCAKCHTISRCECGGAHQKVSEKAPISCSHCLTQVLQWKCNWCNHPVPSLLSRGIDRHHHELGLLFPGIATHIASADHPITDVIQEGLVIATPGMSARTEHGYSAVVILEGNRFLNQPDMRATERVREMYFSHAALAAPGGEVVLIQDEGNPISTALTTWNPSIAIHHDLEERKNLALPPYVRTALMSMESEEITRLKSALVSAREESRLPESTTIRGPIPSGEKSSLILTVNISEGEALVSTIHEFMRRRSAAKKSLPSLRIDPYSLAP